MKQINFAWIVGGALFVAIAVVWVWQLPNALSIVAGGKNDASIVSIISSFTNVKKNLSPDFAALQNEFDGNMEKISSTIVAESAKAEAIEKLKKDLNTEVARKKIQAAISEPDKNNPPQ